MIAYLRAEPGDELIRSLLEDNANVCYAHAMNITEVFYDFLRGSDEKTADAAVGALLADGVNVREDMDWAFCRDLGKLKAAHRIAVADCFCLALGRRLSAEVLTTDHHELDALAPLGLCAIQFIR